MHRSPGIPAAVLLLLFVATASCTRDPEMDCLAPDLDELIAESLRRAPPGAIRVDGGVGTDSAMDGTVHAHGSSEYRCGVAGMSADPPHLVLEPLRHAVTIWLQKNEAEVFENGASVLNGQLRRFGLRYEMPNGTGWVDVRGLFEEDGAIRRVFVVISEVRN
jgi:hypothetical protein